MTAPKKPSILSRISKESTRSRDRDRRRNTDHNSRPADKKRKHSDTDPSNTDSAKRHKRKVQKQHQIKCDGNQSPPWLRGCNPAKQSDHPTAAFILNEEMKYFAEYISPTPEEHQMRKWVIAWIQRIVDTVRLEDIDAKIKCFGSFSTMLYLPTSDIDVIAMLYEKNQQSQPEEGKGRSVSHKYSSNKAVKSLLYKLAQRLQSAGFCTRCLVLGRARIPIIKTHESITGIAVDISVNSDSGLVSAMAQRLFSGGVYPKTLRALVLAIKQFLSQHEMNDASTGGLGSYAVTLLVVSFLQLGQARPSNGSDLYNNLGGLLLGFLELYGKSFDYQSNGISVRENGKYFAKADSPLVSNKSNPPMLVIEDPCDPTNNVGKSANRMDQIKQAFSDAHDLLADVMNTYTQNIAPSEPNNTTHEHTNAVSNSDEKDNRDGVDGTHSSNSSSMNAGKDDKARTVVGPSVSFLSIILQLNRSAIESRKSITRAFHSRAMQRTLGIKYQKHIPNALPNESSADFDDPDIGINSDVKEFLDSLK